MVVWRGWRETIMSYGRVGGSAGLSGSAGISGSTETSGKNSRKTTRGEWGVDLNLGLGVAEVEESMDMYVVGNVKVSFKKHFGRVRPYCIFKSEAGLCCSNLLLIWTISHTATNTFNY